MAMAVTVSRDASRPSGHPYAGPEMSTHAHRRMKSTSQRRARATSLEPAKRGDVSLALLSPGFSQGIFNNREKRENLALSLNVMQQQEELIQARMHNMSCKTPGRRSSTARRAPERLTLTEAALSRNERLCAQTAPLHGNFPHGRERLRDLLPPIRPETLSPPESGRLLPPLKQHLSLPNPVPQRTHPLTPPTPGTARPDRTSPASMARLQARKERYLTHCAAAFDALYADCFSA